MSGTRTNNDESHNHHRRDYHSSSSTAEDAPTPIISNRAMLASQKIPPPISLPAPPQLQTTSISTTSTSRSRSRNKPPQSARFSSSEDEPILMTSFLATATKIHSDLQQIQETTTLANQRKQPLLHSLRILPLLTLNDSPWGILGSSLTLLLEAMIRKILYQWQQQYTFIPNSIAARKYPRASPLHQVPNNNNNNHHLGLAVLLPHQEPRGIPNQGQTCFLNSVLQALASLEPFMVYLERLVELNQERHEFSARRDDNNSNNDDNDSLSAQLLSLLRRVNHGGSSFMDTRQILKMVAKQHPQFKPGGQQQDAEELLQVMVGSIVEEAEFHLLSSSVPSAFVRSLVLHKDNLNNNDDDDEILTVASSLHEGRSSNGPPAGGIQQVDSSASSSSSVSYCVLVSNKNNKEESTSGSLASLSETYPTSSQREEKKQEDFEIHVPRVCSEENMLLENVPVQQVDTPPASNNDSDSLSDDDDMSSKEKRLSAAMQIMMSTTSSLSPSPFCSWIGSALQCHTCRHVRPIQNSPLFDIPVVPTAVSEYLGTTTTTRRCAAEACRLEDCLEDFTTVERVQGVECRSCTLLRKKVELEEDIAMYQDALASSFAKKGNNNSQHLRLELQRAQARLRLVTSTSVDDEDVPLAQVLDPENELANDGSFKMERHDSYKCLLLTRLPAVLTIHIQRRYYDPVRNCMAKTIQHVIFPELLNVAPYCANGGRRDAATCVGNKQGSQAEIPIQYRLQAVIEHRGDAYGGHYVAWRKMANQWFFVSDSTVKKVDWTRVRQCQAYLLFYEATSCCAG